MPGPCLHASPVPLEQVSDGSGLLSGRGESQGCWQSGKCGESTRYGRCQGVWGHPGRSDLYASGEGTRELRGERSGLKEAGPEASGEEDK